MNKKNKTIAIIVVLAILAIIGKIIEKDDTQNTSKVKINAFNDINKTREELSKNGIGILSEWKSDGMGGYTSITNYYVFGNTQDKSSNNIAYYLQSDSVDYIKSLNLTLNINNNIEKKEAIDKFTEMVKKTFSSLSLDLPNELLNNINTETEYNKNNPDYSIKFTIEKNKIEIWQLIIETK